MNKKPLNILIAASEAAPLAKAGGLGDVAGSLPLALRDLGCRVVVVLPAYRQALEQAGELRLTAVGLLVRLGTSELTADILMGKLAPDVPVCLVRQDEFFDRGELYGNSHGEYPDNLERFMFFSRSIPALCSAGGFEPDLILANDWQTGLVMALLHKGALPRTAGVFAIHNMGYLGLVPPEKTEDIGLPDSYYGMDGMEYYGQMSLLKAGIVYSQAVITVSPTYAKEIQTPESGAGLDGLMRSIKDRLYGILNGVNYEEWNPATDTNLAANYSPGDLAGKAMCKQDLLKTMGLPDELLDRPVIGMVTRLFDQKGCQLVAEAAEDLFALNTGIVLLARGDEDYESLFSELQGRYPDRFGLKLGFDAVLAHKIVAGCDMFMIPSLYEPCGLTQMFSLKYGTIPVVRATGGLEDTVTDPNEGDTPGTGFKFAAFEAGALLKAVARAVETFHDGKAWQAMMLEGMAKDFSWERSAKEYLAVFERAIATRRGEKGEG
jgi:starch synthase